MTQELSAEQYRKNIQELLPQIGLKAECYTAIETEAHRKTLYSAAIYPHGISAGTREGYLRLDADTLADLWRMIQENWAGYKDRHRQQVIRKMALAIIKNTADIGECSDAALLGEFDRAEINAYGEEACIEADTMAGRGPFKIKTIGRSNGAPGLEVA